VVAGINKVGGGNSPTQNMKLTKFTKKDLPLIKQWFRSKKNRQFMNDIKVLDTFIEDTASRKIFCIYKRKPIGYCALKNIKFCPELIIMIDSKYWGKGYGAKAMKLLEKEAKRLKIKKLILRVLINNGRAIKLYYRSGYAITQYVMEKNI